jgi:Pyridoxamine 5'-phosphate oxidase
VVAAAPQLADDVRARFDAHGLALLATVRADGSPRISGIEPLFAGDHLWFGMMEGSRKGADLGREPRFALHSATIDKAVTAGDAKVVGSAVAVTDQAAHAAFVEAFAAATGAPPPPGPFELFRADVREISLLRPAGDHLDIRWWREGVGERQLDRF